jgi:hypothetical protein
MSLHTGLDEIHAADLPHFSVGGILWRSFWLTVWNLGGFIGVGLVVCVPVAVVAWLLARYAEVDLTPDIQLSGSSLAGAPGQIVEFFLLAFLALMMFLMIQAGAVYRAFRSLGGDRADVDACVARSFAVMLHLGEFAIVASILLSAFAWLIYSETSWLLAQDQVGIAIFFGILLAGVCVFITVGCWVVFPAIVIERIGPVAAILRSWRLTRDRRWHILVFVVLFAAFEWAISYALGIDIQIPVITNIAPVGLEIFALLNLLLAFLGAVVAAASYYNLVGEKDGVTALSRIFA